MENNTEILQGELVTVVPASQGVNKLLFTQENTEHLVQVFVNNEVVNFDTTQEQAEALVKAYARKKVKDKDDLKGYTEVKAAHSELVKIRTSTDKKRMALGSPYDLIKKGITKYAKDNIIGVLADTEARLKTEKEKFEKWEQEEKDRLEREAEAEAKRRVSELKENGLQFNGELYSIGEINLDILTIKKLSATDYAFLLEKVKAAKAKIDKEEAEAKAEAERLEAERMEAQRKVMEQEEANRKEAEALFNEKLEMRAEKLESLGFENVEQRRMFLLPLFRAAVHFDYEHIVNLSAVAFKNLLSEIKQEKEACEQERKEAEARAKVQKQEKEQVTAPDAVQIAKEDTIKALTAKTVESLSDWEKLTSYLQVVKEVIRPELSEAAAQHTLNRFINEIDKILKEIE